MDLLVLPSVPIAFSYIDLRHKYLGGGGPWQDRGMSPLNVSNFEVIQQSFFMRSDRESIRHSQNRISKDFFTPLRNQLDDSLKAAEIMQRQGIFISHEQAYFLLQECTKNKNLEYGRRVQQLMVHSKLDSIAIFADHLVRLFASCGSLIDANEAFNKIASPSIYTWSAVIDAHAKHGQCNIAVELYNRMLMSGVLGDKYVYVAVLKACSMASALEQGRLSHSQMTKSGLQLDLAVGNILLDMYAKSGSLEEALDVFYTWPSRNVVSWNAMIAGYAQHGEGFSAVKCFENMSQSGVKPNNVTFSSILKACGIIQAIEKGRCMHGSIIQNGLQNDVFVGSGLVDMYVKCECLEEARYILDKLPSKNAVHWGAMIAGYAQHGEELAALNCFESMQNEGIKPDKLTYPSILKACAGIGAIERGRHIHKQIRKDGLQHDAYVGSILVDMYAKCGNLEEACEIFQSMMKRDMVLWAAMVSGYAQSDNVNLAGQCLEQMQQEGIFPCRVMFTSILAACSRAGLVNEGLKYFRLMTENYDIMPDDSHYNCIVDLFGRAGYLNQAVNLLQSNRCNIVGWTSLLSACRTYGIVDLGRHCFDRVVHLDSHFSGGYVLMSGIYSDAFMWQSAAEIEERRQRAGAWKKPGKAWIEINDKVNEFMVGDKGHPQSREISETLKRLNKEVKKQGYTPKLDLVLQKMSDEEKEETLCGHCERLAIAFGLLNTHPGTTIRITKNLRVCSDCHSVTKLISQIEMRDIIIQDAYRLHHFRDGICSCGDYY